MKSASQTVDSFMAEVENACTSDPRLTSLAGAILAGSILDVAHDSRGCAKALGIEHALVLREVQNLADLQRLRITKRDLRTQRCHYEMLPVVGNDNV